MAMDAKNRYVNSTPNEYLLGKLWDEKLQNVCFLNFLILIFIYNVSILAGPDTVIDDVLSTGKFPNLQRWIEDMKKDKTIQACHTRPEILKNFWGGLLNGNYVYDLE